jgi:hypothetical protein
VEIAGLRDGRLIARPSFFQLDNLRKARRRRQPWHLIVHEDVLIFRNPGPSETPGARSRPGAPGSLRLHAPTRETIGSRTQG